MDKEPSLKSRSPKETSPRKRHAFEILPPDGTGVTPTILKDSKMTREQAINMLNVAKQYPKGTIREEFLKQAREVLSANQR